MGEEPTCKNTGDFHSRIPGYRLIYSVLALLSPADTQGRDIFELPHLRGPR